MFGLIKRFKAWVVYRWASQLKLYVVRVETRAGTEYLVDKYGAWRRLAK